MATADAGPSHLAGHYELTSMKPKAVSPSVSYIHVQGDLRDVMKGRVCCHDNCSGWCFINTLAIFRPFITVSGILVRNGCF